VRALLILFIALTPSAILAAESTPDTLSFEIPSGGWFAGWHGGPQETLFVDSTTVHGGRYAARIERTAENPSDDSAAMRGIRISCTGEFIELRGWLKLENVTDGFAGLWMSEDSPGKPGVQFENMWKTPLKGTDEWKEYRIVMKLDARATTLRFGAHLHGHGKVWIDDMRVLVDGKPISGAPARAK